MGTLLLKTKNPNGQIIWMNDIRRGLSKTAAEGQTVIVSAAEART